MLGYFQSSLRDWDAFRFAHPALKRRATKTARPYNICDNHEYLPDLVKQSSSAVTTASEVASDAVMMR